MMNLPLDTQKLQRKLNLCGSGDVFVIFVVEAMMQVWFSNFVEYDVCFHTFLFSCKVYYLSHYMEKIS